MNESSVSNMPEIDNELYQVLGLANMTGSPERRLLLAIIERAILDLVGNEAREVEEAEEWLFNHGDTNGYEAFSSSAFSFPWICEQLDLDIKKISSKIRNMPKRGTHRVAPWYFSKNVANN